VVSIKDNS